MKRILVASHGPLCKGLIESASLIAGDEPFKDVSCISITMSDSHEQIRSMVDELLSSFNKDDEILALTDVYGGSITTVISEYIGIRNLEIITGVNLGMFLEAVFMLEQMSIDELVKHLLNQGRNGIHYVNAELESDCEKEDEI